MGIIEIENSNKIPKNKIIINEEAKFLLIFFFL